MKDIFFLYSAVVLNPFIILCFAANLLSSQAFATVSDCYIMQQELQLMGYKIALERADPSISDEEYSIALGVFLDIAKKMQPLRISSLPVEISLTQGSDWCFLALTTSEEHYFNFNIPKNISLARRKASIAHEIGHLFWHAKMRLRQNYLQSLDQFDSIRKLGTKNPRVRRFFNLMQSIKEVSGDLIAVIYSGNPSVMRDAFLMDPDLPEIEAVGRDFSVFHNPSTWNQIGLHLLFSPVRSFLWHRPIGAALRANPVGFMNHFFDAAGDYLAQSIKESGDEKIDVPKENQKLIEMLSKHFGNLQR